ncbi:DJ-1/PfpI family protein, partial [Vibrio parahaemolyticus]
DAADDVDILVLAPVPREQWGAIDPRVTELVRRADARGAWLLSVCSGSFVLAAAGVLDGRRATTHWRYAQTMARMYPKI